MSILVPLDFAPASDAAASLAAEVARDRQTDVRLIHVVPLPGVAILSVEPLVIPPALWDELLGENRQESEGSLEERADQVRGRGVEVTTALENGGAADIIVEQSADAELVVMGSHGAGMSERIFFGSVAEAVARDSRAPVLVTRSNTEPKGRWERVVVGIDLSESSLAIARAAAAFVAPGGVLELITVLHTPVMGTISTAVSGAASRLQAAVQEERARAAGALDQLIAELGADGYTASGSVEEGRTAEILVSRGDQAGLVVVGAHPRRALGERVLGTTADRVLRHSSVPVLLFPTSREDE